MNKSEALKEMKKLWGEKAAYRRNEQALTGEERQALINDLPAIKEAEKNACQARDARREELLKDPEYVRLHALAKEAVEARQSAAGRIYSRRVTVGKIEGGFFIVKGDGDNWAEAVAQAKGEK